MDQENPNAFLKRSDYRGFFFVVAQLALLAGFVFLFGIQQRQGFPVLLAISIPLFVVYVFVPLRWRPVLLLGAFAAICLWALGFVTGGVVLFVSSCIFITAELRIKLIFRLLLLAVIVSAMVVLRNQWFFAPRAIIAMPYVATLFMFRLILYFYYQKKSPGKAPLYQRMLYFFLLPNLVFLLFPVIDYRNFTETFYSRPALAIYRRGIYRLTFGVFLLFAHRIVYYYFSIAPENIRGLDDLVYFGFVTYFMVIQVVGIFMICVGWVTLFGYDLPTVFGNFFLAKGFSDLWRKINHYWRDFVLKIFYFPFFFRLRKMGQYKAMAIAGVSSFFFTWMMHSYQLYWITGNFSLSANDAIYWMTMGVFITADGIYQFSRMNKPKKQRSIPAQILFGGLRITGILVFAAILWTLWNADNMQTWIFVMKQGAHFNGSTLLYVLGLLLVFIGITGMYRYFAGVPTEEGQRRRENFVFPAVSSLLLVALILFRVGANSLPAGSRFATIADQIGETRVNDIDREMVDLGYYDQMTDAGGIARTGGQFRLFGDLNWGKANGAAHPTNDLLLRAFNANVKAMHHGYHIYTNSFGIRDDEYAIEKTAGVVRWEFLGGSYVLGAGVEKEFTFEALAEKALNDSLKKNQSPGLEILNFSNGGYHLPQAVELCRKTIFNYHPDAVFYFAHPSDIVYTESNVARLVAYGVDLHVYPELQQIVDDAGLQQSMSRVEMTRRLEPFGEKLVRWGYRSIADMCRQHGVTPVWVFLPTTTDGDTQQDFNRLSGFARGYGFTIVDLSGVYANHRESEIQVGEPDTHPNETGHKLIAEKLEAEVRKQPSLFTTK